MSKVPLSYKPTDEEEEYLAKTGKLDSWTNTIRNWIEQDKKLTKKQLFDKIQNSLILLFIGIMAFMLGTLIPTISFINFFMITILFILSFVAITYSSMSILWELILNGRRK